VFRLFNGSVPNIHRCLSIEIGTSTRLEVKVVEVLELFADHIVKN